jgi:hypothetical protein
VNLQVALRNFILRRFREGSLGRLSESEFRQVAFDSHPAAYTEGGLIMVTLLSTQLLPHIAGIPKAEFSPLSGGFVPSMVQVFDTTALIVPEALGLLYATAAGSAHSGVLTNAASVDLQNLQNAVQLGQLLDAVKRYVQSGRMDHVGLLDQLMAGLARPAWPNGQLAQLARDLVQTIENRRATVMLRYHRESTLDPAMRAIFQLFDRTAF